MNDLTQHVSRETVEKLRAFERLVLKWSPAINLISKNDLPSIWQRHILDSLQILTHASDWTTWTDIGSGGGFPGVIVACAASSSQSVTMIESDARKAAFLRTAVREIGLPAQVIAQRIEDAPPQKADIVSARALAPLEKLLGLSVPHLKDSGTAIFLKGNRYEAEIRDADAAWTFSCAVHDSKTAPDGKILLIGDIRRRGGE
ncbi:16S rRNA (guanine(527)-N(7))-methyltransferase RsmG [Mesobaculum littorinae]|uniref:Ribosomal RNA small subunit methyltransferase G n=1 Tax=Mesobaculum littorinae TaxID=2486419 RepID=A0A438AH36_9RHOB|nr:16S rRNA (guanine(527)-N(7))-methyltransferase RsmG [Mesobaculum littorinae]RVV98020.1 16S rRNA (guanine(527)-N(7))-methyltransferase RsmG [Mesobaculum littorinae]